MNDDIHEIMDLASYIQERIRKLQLLKPGEPLETSLLLMWSSAKALENHCRGALTDGDA